MALQSGLSAEQEQAYLAECTQEMRARLRGWPPPPPPADTHGSLQRLSAAAERAATTPYSARRLFALGQEPNCPHLLVLVEPLPLAPLSSNSSNSSGGGGDDEAAAPTYAGHRLRFLSDVGASLLVHWGLVSEGSERWTQPPESMWPPRTVMSLDSVDSEMSSSQGNLLEEMTLVVPAGPRAPASLSFVLQRADTAQWYKVNTVKTFSLTHSY